MIKKVVYIGYQRLTVKVREDFYFQSLTDQGLVVEYWDLTDIFFNNIYIDSLLENYIMRINSFPKLEDCLRQQNLDCTLFITNITFEYRVITLYRILSKYKCKTAFFARGAQPYFSEKPINMSGLSMLRKAFNVHLLFGFIRNKYTLLLKKFGVISPFSIVFRAGKFGIRTIGVGYYVEEEKSCIVDINSFDFDSNNATLGNSRIVKNNYCVFLDEYLPYHPDFDILNIRNIDPDIYFRKINYFFEFIEKKYNIEVVIAAHPKALNYNKINPFNSRKLIFGETSNLVRYSEFVMAHCSSSLSYAVLNSKQIFHLTVAESITLVPFFYDVMLGYSKELGSSIISIDECGEYDEIIFSDPDTHKYSKYRYAYLTSEKSEKRISSMVFIDAVLSL
jgi:hypothetical protein